MQPALAGGGCARPNRQQPIGRQPVAPPPRSAQGWKLPEASVEARGQHQQAVDRVRGVIRPMCWPPARGAPRRGRTRAAGATAAARAADPLRLPLFCRPLLQGCHAPTYPDNPTGVLRRGGRKPGWSVEPAVGAGCKWETATRRGREGSVRAGVGAQRGEGEI